MILERLTCGFGQFEIDLENDEYKLFRVVCSANSLVVKSQFLLYKTHIRIEETGISQNGAHVPQG